jgi:hypothetical protein
MESIIASLEPNTLIYFAVGCACNSPSGFGYHNQQYPSFLEPTFKKLGFKKMVVILIDPSLDKITVPKQDNVTVHTFKQNWSWFFDHKPVDEDVVLFYQLVQSTLFLYNKLIVMDFSGRNIKPLFYNLIRDFDFDQVIKNICIDPCNDQGCYVEFKPDMVQVKDNNFVQEQYMPLVLMRNPETSFRDRINKLCYPVTKGVHDLLFSQEPVEVINPEVMNQLALTYRQETFSFRSDITHTVDSTNEQDIVYISELLEWLNKLSETILTDIIKVKGLNPILIDEKMSLIKKGKRSEFQNWLYKI